MDGWPFEELSCWTLSGQAGKNESTCERSVLKCQAEEASSAHFRECYHSNLAELRFEYRSIDWEGIFGGVIYSSSVLHQRNLGLEFKMLPLQLSALIYSLPAL